MRRPPPRSSLFPYTTLFRSQESLPVEFDGNAVQVDRTSERLLGERDASLLEGIAEHEHVGCDGIAHQRRGELSGRRSEEHTSELQSQFHLVCRLLLDKKKGI